MNIFARLSRRIAKFSIGRRSRAAEKGEKGDRGGRGEQRGGRGEQRGGRGEQRGGRWSPSIVHREQRSIVHGDQRPNTSFHGGPVSSSRRDFVSDLRSSFVSPDKQSSSSASGQQQQQPEEKEELVVGSSSESPFLSHLDYEDSSAKASCVRRTMRGSVESLDRPFVERDKRKKDSSGHPAEQPRTSLRRFTSQRSRKWERAAKKNPSGAKPRLVEQVAGASKRTTGSSDPRHLHSDGFHAEPHSQRRTSAAVSLNPRAHALSSGSDETFARHSMAHTRPLARLPDEQDTDTAASLQEDPSLPDDPRRSEFEHLKQNQSGTNGGASAESRWPKSEMSPAVRSCLFKLRSVLFDNNEDLDTTLSVQNLPTEDLNSETGLRLDSEEDHRRQEMSVNRRSSSLSDVNRYHRYLNFVSSRQEADLSTVEVVQILQTTLRSPEVKKLFELDRAETSSVGRVSHRGNDALGRVQNKRIAAIMSPKPFEPRKNTWRPQSSPAEKTSEVTDCHSPALPPECHSRMKRNLCSLFKSEFKGTDQNGAIEVGESTNCSPEPHRQMAAEPKTSPLFHFRSQNTPQHSTRDHLLRQLIEEENAARNDMSLPVHDSSIPFETDHIENPDESKPFVGVTHGPPESSPVKGTLSNLFLARCTAQDIRRQSKKGWSGSRHPDLT